MLTREQIQARLDDLENLKTTDEPEEFNDRDEEERWYGVDCKIEMLYWVLGEDPAYDKDNE